MSDALITAAGMRVIRLLVGHPPRNVGDLIRETGVTRTAVTEQLNDLVAAGFAERTIERLPGRGRPRHLYSATKAALVMLFANNQQLVVPAIWRTVEAIGGEELTQQVLKGVCRKLLEHYAPRITATTPKKRLEQFAKLLEEEGGMIELESENGQVTVTKRTCAFISMFDGQRRVCTIDMDLLSTIVGCPVRQVECRHNSRNACCRFEIETPVHGHPPAVGEFPGTCAATTAVETPAADQQAAVVDSPVVVETPAAVDAPAIAESPVCLESPAVTIAPASDVTEAVEPPEAVETPVAFEMPAVVEIAATIEAPIVVQTSVCSEASLNHVGMYASACDPGHGLPQTAN